MVALAAAHDWSEIGSAQVVGERVWREGRWGGKRGVGEEYCRQNWTLGGHDIQARSVVRSCLEKNLTQRRFFCKRGGTICGECLSVTPHIKPGDALVCVAVSCSVMQCTAVECKCSVVRCDEGLLST